MDRGPLGLDQASSIGLTTRLFGERAQHRSGASAALDRDQQSGSDEVAERVVDVVGEPSEHDRRILTPEAGGQSSHLRSDRSGQVATVALIAPIG